MRNRAVREKSVLKQSESSTSQGTHLDHVRLLFEEPDWYFRRRAFDIRIRVETIQELVTVSGDARVLDIGCGDGSISLPLLTDRTRLTLLDVSAQMLSMAKSKVPPELAENVDTVNDDFMKATFAPESFDVILCIGLLAHVQSPVDVIAKMMSLLKEGGVIVVECTDTEHFTTLLSSPLHRIWSMIRPPKYRLQPITYAWVSKMFARYNLHPAKTFRYGAPPKGIHRVLSQQSLYRCSRLIFGTVAANRNSWLGNEYISIFTSRSATP